MDLAQVESALRSQLFGQDAAITALLPIVEIFQAGLSPEGRPAATFLLLGPTGTGKTKTVEAFAKALHGSEKTLVKVDCGEFHSEHEVAKILGSPPGYLGHRETTPLITPRALKDVTSDQCDLSIVLFDEIEKAAPSLFRALLGVLDKGVLTLGDNTKTHFDSTIIFLTSNLGAKAMQDCLHPSIGFAGPTHSEEAIAAKLQHIGQHAARRKFSPEFMNRLDAVITYDPLTEDALRKILSAEIAAVGEQIRKSLGILAFTLLVHNPAREYLLKHGTSRLYGARELKRLMQREMVQPLARLINAKKVFPGGAVSVTADDRGLVLTPRMSTNFLGSAV